MFPSNWKCHALLSEPLFALFMAYITHPDPSPIIPQYLGVPILIQVVDTGDTAAVTIGVVHMADVTCSISGIASHHCLWRHPKDAV